MFAVQMYTSSVLCKQPLKTGQRRTPMTLIYGDTGSDKKNSGLSSETTASWDDGQKQL